MTCPKCKSENVTVQAFQEQETKTVSKTKPRKSERHYGFLTRCLYWAIIGWWYRPIKKLFSILTFGGRRDKSDDLKTVSRTKSKVTYKNMCVCQSCGHRWEMR